MFHLTLLDEFMFQLYVPSNHLAFLASYNEFLAMDNVGNFLGLGLLYFSLHCKHLVFELTQEKKS